MTRVVRTARGRRGSPLGIQWVEARDTAQHPAVHRQPLTTELPRGQQAEVERLGAAQLPSVSTSSLGTSFLAQPERSAHQLETSNNYFASLHLFTRL